MRRLMACEMSTSRRLMACSYQPRCGPPAQRIRAFRRDAGYRRRTGGAAPSAHAGLGQPAGRPDAGDAVTRGQRSSPGLRRRQAAAAPPGRAARVRITARRRLPHKEHMRASGCAVWHGWTAAPCLRGAGAGAACVGGGCWRGAWRRFSTATSKSTSSLLPPQHGVKPPSRHRVRPASRHGVKAASRHGVKAASRCDVKAA